MEIGSNTLNENGELANLDWDDDEEFGATEPTLEEYINGDTSEYTPEELLPDVIEMLLRDKGISDPSRIKFANDDDLLEERDWNSLSAEEQYNILAQEPIAEQYNVADQLSDEEILLLNAIRQNGLTPSEYIGIVTQQGVENYILNLPGPNYEVDGFTDEELFMADLKIRTPNITDEELQLSLELAKLNPELFEKQIVGLREEYKELERQNQEEEEAINQELLQALYLQFGNTILDSIDQLQGIGGIDIELDDSDKEQLAEYILGYDLAGLNHLLKALSDPNVLTQVAWFLLKGEETIDGLINYFTREISKVRENSFKKGQESGDGSPQLVVKPLQTRRLVNFTQKPVTSIDDLD